ncbi:MAG TPA: hypothetical protein PKD26_13665 [Pyrinomonadaceae bacterium]|nr:hypothetical protein [Pyrinomonadaceae bacterium]
MRWFHLGFGLLLFVVFLITGQYMRADFPDKEVIGQDLRLLMRSRHIYILFNALIHISLGVYLQMRPERCRTVSQFAGSAALTAAAVFVVLAWRTETYELQHFSDLSREGIYLSLAGVILHLIGGLGSKRDH